MIGLLILAALLVVASSSSSASSRTSTTPQPLRVVGDSFGVGIAAAASSPPFAGVTSSARVGAPASATPAIAQADGYAIVSLGTNDAAAGASPSAIASSVRRVLGPYADGTARRGYLAFVVPHSQMTDRALAARTAAAAAALRSSLRPWARLRLVEIRANAGGADRLHFDRVGYGEILLDALRSLNGMADDNRGNP